MLLAIKSLEAWNMRLAFSIVLLGFICINSAFADRRCATALKLPHEVTRFYLATYGIRIDSSGLRFRTELEDPDIQLRRETAEALLQKPSDRKVAGETIARLMSLPVLSRFVIKSQDPHVKALETIRLSKSRERESPDLTEEQQTKSVEATDDLTDEMIQEVFQWTGSRYSTPDNGIVEENIHPLLQWHLQKLVNEEAARAAFVADLELLLKFLRHRN